MTPAIATSELHAKRGVGRWPSHAQARMLLGITSNAKTVATTPDVMWRSAR
jgi:hypothetical protein